MSNITIIVATGLNNEIGTDNKLLWHFKKDMEFFKEMTMGKPIVMGRKTFESLPHMLSNRLHIVLTKQSLSIPGVIVLHSIKEVLEIANNYDEVVIIGGASIYKMFIDYANKMYITKVYKEYKEADCYYPEFNYRDWEKRIIKKEYENDTLLEFNEYTRKLVKKN